MLLAIIAASIFLAIIEASMFLQDTKRQVAVIAASMLLGRIASMLLGRTAFFFSA